MPFDAWTMPFYAFARDFFFEKASGFRLSVFRHCTMTSRRQIDDVTQTNV